MRGRIPKAQELKRTILGILQSTAFLTTNAFSYSAYLCTLGKIFGGYNIWTVSYVPAFMASLTAILVERPSRRSLLTLYVANNATDSLWRMAVSRGMVKGIPNGQVAVFGISASFLLYYFRSGMHFEENDSVFSLLRFIVGKDEEGRKPEYIESLLNEDQPEALEAPPPPPPSTTKRRSRLNNYLLVQAFLKLYNQVCDPIKKLPVKHEKCPHSNSCVYYTISGGAKLFSIGLVAQATLRIVLQMKSIIRAPRKIKQVLFSRDTLKIGAFLGGFSFIYRVS